MRAFIPLLIAAAGITACSQDPNVLKQKYVANGDKYYRLGKFPQAAIMYRTALRKDARYGEAYLHLGRAFLRMGKMSMAYPALRRAVELLPEGSGRVEARISLADLYLDYFRAVGYDRTQAEETGRLADDLIRLNSKSFHGYRIRGSMAALDAANVSIAHPKLSHDTLLEAIAALRTADSLQPFQTSVVTPLSQALWAAGQPAEAEEFLTSQIRHQKSLSAPNSVERYTDLAAAYSELCRLYLGTGRTPATEKLLQQAIADQEGSPKQHLFLEGLAHLFQSLGRRAEMAQTLEKLKAQAVSFPEAYEVAGRLYLKSGDFRQAIGEYEQGIQAFPKTKSSYQALIVEALRQGDQRTEAYEVNESLLKDKPKDLDALTRRVGFLIERGQVDNAVAELAGLVQQAPNSAPIRFQAGRGLIAQGRREAARVQFAQAIRLDPKFVAARISLAELELDTGEFGAALLAADEILELDGRDGKAMLIRAAALRNLGKAEEARKTFEELVAHYPNYSEALFQFGVLNAQQNKVKEATALYLRSFEVNPENLAGLDAVVQSLIAKNDPENALKIVKSAIAKYPNSPALEITLAAAEMHTGHFDVAISGYQRLLTEFQKNPKALGHVYFHLAICYRRKGDIPAAIGQLEHARALLPEYSPIFHNLGVLNDMLGKRAAAQKFYEASLKLDGNDATVLNNLAFYMAENGGDLDQALTYAQRARQRAPHDLTFSDTIGFIYLKKNLVDNALDVLQVIVDKSPNEPVFRLHLAEALLQKGDTAKGRQELKTALASKPSAEQAATIHQLLSKIGT